MTERNDLIDETPEEKDLTCVKPFANPEKEIVESRLIIAVARKIAHTLFRKIKSVVIVEGDAYSGRRTACELAQRILERTGNKTFKDVQFLEVDMASWADDEEKIAEYFTDIINHYKTDESNGFVFYLGDFESIPTAFTTSFSSIKEKLESLQPDILKFMVIKEKDYEDGASIIGDLEMVKDALFIDNENEFDYLQIAENLIPTVRKLEKMHNVKCSKELVQKLILMIASNDPQCDVSYYQAIHTLDSLMSVAEFEGNGEETEVAERQFRYVFVDDYAVYDGLTDEEKEQLARHEVGHAILMLSLGKKLYDVQGIKIIYDNMCGNAGVTYSNELYFANSNREVVKGKIAVNLAGRILENSVNKGAEVDLKKANDIAREFVMRTGELLRVCPCFTLSDNDICLSESVRHRVIELVINLINEAEFMAKGILRDNKNVAEDMVKELLKTGLLTKEQIYKIWNKYH